MLALDYKLTSVKCLAKYSLLLSINYADATGALPVTFKIEWNDVDNNKLEVTGIETPTRTAQLFFNVWLFILLHYRLH
jgi:hypothetical protein